MLDDIEVHPDLLSTRNNWQQKQPQENDYDHNDFTAKEAEEVLGDLRDLLWQQPQPHSELKFLKKSPFSKVQNQIFDIFKSTKTHFSLFQKWH